MSQKEEIIASLDELEDENIERVHALIRHLKAIQEVEPEGTFMSRLMEIKMEGPSDFSKNLDKYLYGGLGHDPDVR
ncbi:MAG: hypothetical protein ACR2GR_01750 [Rhodothermales bacterium]